MNYKITHECNTAQWQEFVENHPQGGSFQTPAMQDYFEHLDNHKAIQVFCMDGNNRLCGLLVAVLQKEHSGPAGIFSSRAVVRGGPLVAEGADASQVADLLLKGLIKAVGRKAIYIEFRNSFDMSALREVFEKNDFEFKPHLNYLVPILDKPAMLKRMNSGKARQIKKSLNKGAKIIEAQSTEQVKEFYDLLVNLYNTKVKKPLPKWEFFEDFYKRKELGLYLLVEFEGKIVAGIMCPVFGKKTIYEWYIANTDQRLEDVYPGVMATWAPLDYAADNGIATFDFMGAGKPDEAYGVREFKAQFGGDLVEHGRFERINNKSLYQVGKLALKTYQKIKK